MNMFRSLFCILALTLGLNLYAGQTNYTVPGISLGSVTAPFVMNVTNSTTATDGQVPVKSGDRLKFVIPSGVGAVTTNNLQSRAFVTPYDFGAVGDGATDDTIPLQKWLDAAGSNNVIAFLAPAIGPVGQSDYFYKITDTLKVTNMHGAYIQGVSGSKFVSSASGSFTRSHIRQFTSGANGILFLSANGSTNAPSQNKADGIRVDSIYIDSNDATFTAGSIGLGFMQDGTDADCDVITQVGVAHFDTGFYIQSLANVIFDACTPGYNAYGVKIAAAYGVPATTSTVANNIMFQNCQLSYNFSNQLWVASGVVSMYNCDNTAFDPAAISAIYIKDHGTLYIDNSRFEEYNNGPAIYINATNHSASVTLRNCGFSNPLVNATTYSIFGTNASLTLLGGNTFNALSSDTYAVKLVDTIDSVAPVVKTLESLSISYIAGATVLAPYYVAGGFMQNVFGAGTVTPQEFTLQAAPHSTAINWNGASQGGYDNNFSIATKARIVMFDAAGTVIMNGPFTIDLLQYFKDTASRIPGVNLWASNSVQVASNTAALLPPTPFSSGAFATYSSNGIAAMMTSDRSATWTDTNYVSIVKSSYLTGDAASTSTSFATTGIGVTVVNGHKYAFVAELYLSDSTAADGAKIDFNGGSATSSNFRAQVTAFDTALNLSTVTTALSTSVAASTFTGAGAFEIHGSFEPSSTGTFIIRFAQNAHTVGTLTLARGSHIVMHDVK